MALPYSSIEGRAVSWQKDELLQSKRRLLLSHSLMLFFLYSDRNCHLISAHFTSQWSKSERLKPSFYYNVQIGELVIMLLHDDNQGTRAQKREWAVSWLSEVQSPKVDISVSVCISLWRQKKKEAHEQDTDGEANSKWEVNKNVAREDNSVGQCGASPFSGVEVNVKRASSLTVDPRHLSLLLPPYVRLSEA